MKALSKPQFITFTGVDEFTDTEEMIRLSNIYPIEWGILFSPKEVRTTRYPPHTAIHGILEKLAGSSVNLSFHLCGKYARDALAGNGTDFEAFLPNPLVKRAQINVSNQTIDELPLIVWGERHSVTPILQCRKAGFPVDVSGDIEYLFDCSGGRGVVAEDWPTGVESRLNGYAGGLRPDNVRKEVGSIAFGAWRYWIDMETGVRNDDDIFDLAKCRKVCEEVYRPGFWTSNL